VQYAQEKKHSVNTAFFLPVKLALYNAMTVVSLSLSLYLSIYIYYKIYVVCNVLLRGGDELTNCTCTYNVVTPPSLSSPPPPPPCYTVGHSSRLFLLLFFFPTRPRAHSDSTSIHTCHYFYVLNRHHLGSSGVIDFHDRVLCAPRRVSVAKTLFIYVLPLSALVNPYRSGDVWPHFILRKPYYIG